MKNVSRLTEMILYPFELLGAVQLFFGRFFWHLATKFLLSPWGLLVPVTILIALFLVLQIDHAPHELADRYAKEFMTCTEEEIPDLIAAALHLDETGIPSLVAGLHSDREAVFLACRDAIQQELKRWADLDDPRKQSRYYRVLASALSEQVDRFQPQAQLVAYGFVRQILRQMPKKTSGTDSGKWHDSTESHQTIQSCERVLLVAENVRRKVIAPDESQDSSSGQTMARFHKRSFHPILMASNGKPFHEEKDLLHSNRTMEYTELSQADMLAAPRAERLLAFHQSPQYQVQADLSKHRPETQSPGPQKSEPLDENTSAIVSALPRTGVSPSHAATREKVAGRYAPENDAALDLPGADGIAQNYIAENRRPKRSNSGTDAYDFLTEDLRRISPDTIARLSSSRLMRLLQHPDEQIVAEARKTLVARDGYREVHLKLAFRLYHPRPSVREGIFAMLSSTQGIQPNAWLTELLNDPNSEIRYRAASTLATSSDPAVLRRVIESGKQDPDARIVDLADRLSRRQGRTSR